MRLHSRAEGLELAQHAAKLLEEELDEFARHRTASGLPPPPPILIDQPPGEALFTAKFSLPPGDAHAGLIYDALSRIVDGSSVEKVEEAGTSLYLETEGVRVVLSIPQGIQTLTMEVSATRETARAAMRLHGQAYALVHTLALAADGSRAYSGTV